MTNREILEVICDMANALQIIPRSRQGQAIEELIDKLQKPPAESTLEEVEKYALAHDYVLWSKEQSENVIRALLLCDPKSIDGLTNGEAMQTVFPEVKVEIDGFLVRCVFIEHEFTTTKEWWNAPYQKDGE